jgi:hypothetical protein
MARETVGLAPTRNSPPKPDRFVFARRSRANGPRNVPFRYPQTLLLLCVDDRYARQIHDVLNLVTSLEHVNGFIHPREHRPGRVGAT